MNWKEYKKLSERTFSYIEDLNKDLNNKQLIDTLNKAHCAIGINTELGELITAIVNKDAVNITEELGDICWYIANLERLIEYNEEGLPVIKNKVDNIDMGNTIIESTELLDIYKKAIYYNRPINNISVINHLENIKMFVANTCKMHEAKIDVMLNTNINKLKVRFPDKFNVDDANNRNIKKEYETMQENITNK